MSIRRFLRIGLVLFLCSTTSCRDHSSQSVRIGALLPLSGSGSNYGRSLRQGLEIAKGEINANGGINGKQLEIIYEDSQGDPKVAISGFEKLSSFDHVPVVIGSISSVVLALASTADREHVVLINSSAMSPKICTEATDYLFSFMVSGSDEARFMASTYVNAHRMSPIAVLYSNNASGIDTRDAFISDLTARGGHIAVQEGYELNSTDFRTQLTKIKASNAQYGYLLAFSSAEFAQILKQSQELGLKIKWYSYSGFETRETLSLAGSAADGVVYSYPSYSGHVDAMQKFQAQYESSYGSIPDVYTTTSYDTMKVLAQAMAQSSDYSPATIRQELLRKSYEGLFGIFKFSEPQCVARQPMWKTVSGGKFVPASGN